MRALIIFALFLLTGPGPGYSLTYAQSENPSGRSNPGRLIINQDERLDELVRRHIEINDKREGLQGYRIRIFSESGQRARSNAENESAKFFNKYPDIETYLDWNPPNFRVYVGDFRTRSEALKIQRKINRDYPNSFIVRSRINFPSLD
jgi:hypothetical protein